MPAPSASPAVAVLYIDDEERAAALAFHLFDRELEGGPLSSCSVRVRNRGVSRRAGEALEARSRLPSLAPV